MVASLVSELQCEAEITVLVKNTALPWSTVIAKEFEMFPGKVFFLIIVNGHQEQMGSTDSVILFSNINGFWGQQVSVVW